MAIEVQLPTLHSGQVEAFKLRNPDGTRALRKAVRCGRRWGKTDFGATIASDGAIKRESIGWFAPEHKFIAEAFNDIADILAPVKRASSKVEGVIRTTTGGRIDFWSLENERAGRSRKYHKVIIDEGAFTKPNMMDIWEKSIEPTLLDYGGSALVLSNTNGNDTTNFLWQLCNVPKHGFIQYHAPSWQNPHVPKQRPGESLVDYLARREQTYIDLRTKTHPLVFRQEYEAEFVDFSGVAFFSLDKLLVDGQPVEYPTICDTVFAIVDSAVKGGQDHDGTAVTYWASSSFGKHPLICLDYDIVSIDGALLETWIPNVAARVDQLARQCKARYDTNDIWIEDAQSGSILLQQCALRRISAQALPSVLTAAGKDARAINASGPVYRGEVKFSRYAFEKNDVEFKGAQRNHLVSQVTGFRVGDKDAYKRADDLLDTFTYSVAITLGNAEGFA